MMKLCGVQGGGFSGSTQVEGESGNRKWMEAWSTFEGIREKLRSRFQGCRMGGMRPQSNHLMLEYLFT